MRKRLRIDLNRQKAWSEEIHPDDLDQWVGGRGLNAKFFFEEISSPIPPKSPENPIAFAVGPLAGTFAPCCGWTSISTFTPISDPPGYAHVSMPGHWGPQLKFAGFDQLIIQGKAEKPIYLWINGEKVKFENARHLWGKDTIETTVAIQEEKEDRNIEILCIGPAGERLTLFANVTNRFSWTGDHIGLGSILGSKHLKAIAIRGDKPVILGDPNRFLRLCLTLRDCIHRNRNAVRLKEEGPFFSLDQNGGGLGIKNFNEASHSSIEKRWGATYSKRYLYGREGCFSCPIHCGRITQFHGNYFGGIHLESAWSLGPRMGIFDWEWTLRFHRACQSQGLDPSSFGSLLAWIMDCYERGILSDEEIGQHGCRWGDGEIAFRIMDWIINGKEAGEIFGQGSYRAARILGKGVSRVAHSKGMDLPIRDPRSSKEYALSVALYPTEWDYLRSLNSFPPQLPLKEGMIERVSALEELKFLADLTSLCPLVVARLFLISASDIAELISAATGIVQEPLKLLTEVQKTIQIEKALLEKTEPGENEIGSLPPRFFEEEIHEGSSNVLRLEKNHWEKAISDYYRLRGWNFPRKAETE